MKKINYYDDELNDDFATTKIEKETLKGYKYNHGIVWRIAAFIIYYIIALPLTRLYNVLIHGEVVKNAKVMRGHRKNGCFIYANHVMTAADAFTPSGVTFPKKAYIIVGAAAVSIPIVKEFVAILGGVPISTDFSGMKAFNEKIKSLAERKKCVYIYPEKHIWPYYTDIRPFESVSFSYPAIYDKPCFAVTRVFKKRLFLKRPRVVTYVDGPFFPNNDLPLTKRKKDLRDRVYSAMKGRSILSDCKYIEYIKRDENAEEELKNIA